eukprot:7565052-Ditylum_brightwellii.AAC.1
MLQTVYDVAAGLYDSILNRKNCGDDGTALLLQEVVEVNVEDPAPAFICLRDRIDYECLRDRLPRVDNINKSVSGGSSSTVEDTSTDDNAVDGGNLKTTSSTTEATDSLIN